jgi:hypothetical protein
MAEKNKEEVAPPLKAEEKLRSVVHPRHRGGSQDRQFNFKAATIFENSRLRGRQRQTVNQEPPRHNDEGAWLVDYGQRASGNMRFYPKGR